MRFLDGVCTSVDGLYDSVEGQSRVDGKGMPAGRADSRAEEGFELSLAPVLVVHERVLGLG